MSSSALTRPVGVTTYRRGHAATGAAGNASLARPLTMIQIGTQTDDSRRHGHALRKLLWYLLDGIATLGSAMHHVSLTRHFLTAPAVSCYISTMALYSSGGGTSQGRSQ